MNRTLQAGASTIGFVGLGVMGKAMARNIRRAGFALVVHNRSRAAVDELAAEGATPAADAATLAAQCDAVAICLPDTVDVENVLFGAQGLAAALRPGAVVIDFSTIAAPAAVAIAQRLQGQGVAMLDVPVSGGPKGAIDGTLSCMIGGDAEVLTRCLPLLQAVGKSFAHIGGNGAGQLCKSCNQLAVFGTLMAVSEALTLARQSGIDAGKVREALLGGSAQSFVLQNQGKRQIDGQYTPGFRASLMRKDIRLVHAAARAADSFAPLTALADQLLGALCNSGRADLDSAAIGLLYDELSGDRSA